MNVAEISECMGYKDKQGRRAMRLNRIMDQIQRVYGGDAPEASVFSESFVNYMDTYAREDRATHIDSLCERARHLLHEKPGLAVFEEDMQIIRGFFNVRAGISPPRLHRKMNERERELVRYLLCQSLPTMPADCKTTYQWKACRKHLVAYRQLLDYYLPEDDGKRCTSTPANSQLMKTWWSWLSQIANWIQSMLDSYTRPDPKQQEALADEFYRVLKRISPYLPKTDRHNHVCLLRGIYHQLAQSTWPPDSRYEYEHALSPGVSCLSITVGLYKKISAKQHNTLLLRALRRDLTRIQCVNRYLSKALWSTDEDEPTNQLSAFLTHYCAFQTQLQHWREAAFAIRTRCERVLRNQRDRTYLQGLDALDRSMEALYEESQGIEADWLSDAKKHVFDFNPSLNDATACLSHLNACRHAMSAIDWVHHTCYEHHDSEGLVTYEFNARNRESNKAYFDEYHVKNTHTLTDFAVSQLENADKKVLRILSMAHPDRYQQSGALFIANYCTQEMGTLRSQAKAMIRFWRLSQWTDATRPNQLLIEEERLRYESEQTTECPAVPAVEPPNKPCNLAILCQLHRPYRAWMKASTAEPKSTTGMKPLHKTTKKRTYIGWSLYDRSPNNAQERWCWRMGVQAGIMFPYIQNRTRAAEQKTALLSKGTAFIEQKTALLSKETALSSKVTALLSKVTSIIEQETALLNQKNAILQQEKTKSKSRELELIRFTIDAMYTLSGDRTESWINGLCTTLQPKTSFSIAEIRAEITRVLEKKDQAEAVFFDQKPDLFTQEKAFIDQEIAFLDQEIAFINQKIASFQQELTELKSQERNLMRLFINEMCTLSGDHTESWVNDLCTMLQSHTKFSPDEIRAEIVCILEEKDQARSCSPRARFFQPASIETEQRSSTETQKMDLACT